MRASSRRTPSPQAWAISWATVARPPRVGSRMKRSPGRSRSARVKGSTLAASECRSPRRPNCSRASITAVPWSPTGPLTRMRSPGRICCNPRRSPGGAPPPRWWPDRARPPRPRHHLGVPGHHPHPDLPRRRRGGADQAVQGGHLQPLLDEGVEAQIEGGGPRHRQVVGGAVHRQGADIAAGELQGLDDEAVGGEQGSPSGRGMGTASACTSSSGLPRWRAKMLSISSRMKRPPLPWERVMWVSCMPNLWGAGGMGGAWNGLKIRRIAAAGQRNLRWGAWTGRGDLARSRC
jgi:hypothetical protein